MNVRQSNLSRLPIFANNFHSKFFESSRLEPLYGNHRCRSHSIRHLIEHSCKCLVYVLSVVEKYIFEFKMSFYSYIYEHRHGGTGVLRELFAVHLTEPVPF